MQDDGPRKRQAIITQAKSKLLYDRVSFQDQKNKLVHANSPLPA